MSKVTYVMYYMEEVFGPFYGMENVIAFLERAPTIDRQKCGIFELRSPQVLSDCLLISNFIIESDGEKRSAEEEDHANRKRKRTSKPHLPPTWLNLFCVFDDDEDGARHV